MINDIKTRRLSLSPLNESDIGFIIKLEQQVESFKYDLEKAPTSDEVITRCNWFIENMHCLPNSGAIRWIVRNDNEMIGEVHFICNWERTREWEIGYKLLKEHWGNGYASEAVKAVIKYAFENFNVNRIAAFLNTANKRSAALVERVGMIREGHLREVRLVNGVYYDEYVFSILKREVITS